MSSIVRDNVVCLYQAVDLLQCLHEETFSKPVDSCFGSSIGGHIRHNIDHYYCFLKGLDTGVINYDARLRDQAVESNPGKATACLLDIIESLNDLVAKNLDQKISVYTDAAVPEPESKAVESTLGRELQFLLSHTVHHFALIAIIAHTLNISVQPDFGVAPSTLKYRQHANENSPCA